jgi:alkanesulfonate monooxygenase SsuD/methylene tetrahydromethanopterin reductase-like flavin-dependent oxidoreductase (luciferase family)
MSTKVKFGYLLDFRQPPQLSRLGTAEFYSAMFQQVEYADHAGLDSIWVTEHHFTEDGYLSAVMPALAAIAARTKRVTIGTYVLLAPFYHPLRLAEDTALIDVISQGRLRLGLGLGYRQEEFAGLQIARNERLGRTLETIDILKRAWTGEPFSFSGKHFNFRDVQVLPRPISQPHPELLWGGMAPEAIRRGAKLGLSFACNLGAREIEQYHQALREYGKDPAAFNVVTSRLVYLADSEEQAWKEIEAPVLYQMTLYGKWLSAAGADTPQFRPNPDALRRNSVIGPPERVTERLQQIITGTPMTEMCLSMQLPGLDPHKALRSLERFSTEVLPVLRKA